MIPISLRSIVILVPVVQNASFTFTTPQNAGFTIGQVFASNSPTGWAILSGDPLGNFSINSAGFISTTNPLSGAGSETLTVQASNQYGVSGPGTVNIQWGAAPVLTAANYSFIAPLAAGASVGQPVASNNPTAWAEISGDPLGDFTVDPNTGAITASQNIASSSSGSETLVVQASNIFGQSQANFGITWTASGPTAAPVITNASFSETLPTTTGTSIAQMAATQSPTSWALLNGNYNGYYNLNTSTGLITAAAPAVASVTNLILQSQTLQTTWNLVVGGTATIGVNSAVAPDGTTTADLIGEDATTNLHRIAQPVTKPASVQSYALSLFAQAQTRTRILLQLDDGGANGGYAVFDLAGGQIGVPGSTFGAGFTAPSTSITSVGNGWYRCVIIGNTNAATTINVTIGIDNGTGTGAQVNSYAGGGPGVGVTVWGVQLEQAASAGPYVRTTTASVARNGQISAVNTLTLTATNSIGTSAPGTAQITAVNPADLPQVATQTFPISLPLSSGQTVGTMTATNGPITNWIFTVGNSSGFFAISNSGVVTVTAAGASGITTPQNFALTAQATNAVGTGVGTCNIQVTTTPVPVVTPTTFTIAT